MPGTRVLAHSEAVRLGRDDAPLSFSRPVPARPEGPGARMLTLDGDDAFSLTFWCGTCPLLFERLGGASRTVSDEFQDRLNDGLSYIDPTVLDAASTVIPEGEYLPLLLETTPRLVKPSEESDYFSHEQVEHRGVNVFWELPENPRMAYYRGGSWKTSEHDFLFEFVVPMVPPGWNKRERVTEYEQVLSAGGVPTVLALSILDRTQPFDSFDSHSGLIHFVLDGHHKLEAAARGGASVRLLSLLSVDDSLSTREELDALIERVKSGNLL